MKKTIMLGVAALTVYAATACPISGPPHDELKAVVNQLKESNSTSRKVEVMAVPELVIQVLSHDAPDAVPAPMVHVDPGSALYMHKALINFSMDFSGTAMGTNDTDVGELRTPTVIYVVNFNKLDKVIVNNVSGLACAELLGCNGDSWWITNSDPPEPLLAEYRQNMWSYYMLHRVPWHPWRVRRE